MRAEDDEHAPQTADDRAAEQRADAHDRVIQPLDAVADPGADGADDRQHDGQHDDQRQTGNQDDLEDLGDDLLQALFQPIEDDDREHDGDDGARIAEDLRGFADGEGRLHDGQAEDEVLDGGVLHQRVDGRVAEEGAEDHRNDAGALEGLRRGVGEEDGHEVEDDVGGGVQNDVGAVIRRKPFQLDRRGEQALDEAGGRDGRNDGREDVGDGLEDVVPDGALVALDLLDGFAVGVHDAALDVDHGQELVIDLVDLAAQNDLELTAGLHDLNDAFELAHRVLAGLGGVPQNQTQTGKAVGCILDVLSAADVVEDTLGYLLVIH